MANSELYSLIFADSLVSNLAINFHREFAIDSAKMFGSYDPFLIVLISSLAFLLACFMNYILGRMLWNVFGKKESNIVTDSYFYLLLILSAVPMVGKFILVLAGFKRLYWLRVLSICGTLKLCYYLFIVFI